MCAKIGFHAAHWVVGNKTFTGEKNNNKTLQKASNAKSKANRMLCKFSLMAEVVGGIQIRI